MKQELPFLQVLFDIDGTLLMAGGVGRRVIDSIVWERYGIADALREIRLHGNTDPMILEETAARHAPAAEKRVFLEHLTKEFLKRMPDALRGNCRLLPKVAQTLERLRGMGVPLGVVTGNYRECADAKLEDTGIAGYFTAGVYTASLHPDRAQILRRALHATGVEAARTLYVGDTPWDVQAALACGCAVFAVSTSLYTPGCLAREGAHFTSSDMQVLVHGQWDFLFKE